MATDSIIVQPKMDEINCEIDKLPSIDSIFSIQNLYTIRKQGIKDNCSKNIKF